MSVGKMPQRNAEDKTCDDVLMVGWLSTDDTCSITRKIASTIMHVQFAHIHSRGEKTGSTRNLQKQTSGGVAAGYIS